MSNSGNILKWAGSKSSSANALMPLLNTGQKYIEPFCGSATFFFKGNHEYGYLNDSNASLIGFYRDVAEMPEKVWGIYIDLEVSEANYYVVRRKFNELDEGVEKSAFFMYLNHFCFNGIFRTNKKGEFNTPFGARKKIRKKTTLEELLGFSKKLKRATLSCKDFEEFLDDIVPQDSCIYMDPPYYTQDRRVFGEYGAVIFGPTDLVRLWGVCNRLKLDNRVVVSYRDCSEFKELFAENLTDEIRVQRNVGGFAGRRKIDSELVAVF